MAERLVGPGGVHIELPSLGRRIERHQATYPEGHILAGQRPGGADLVLAGHDYLALGEDERILESQMNALAFPTGGRPLLPGVYMQYGEAERRLEHELAALLGAEAGVVCQSGFAAGEGIMQVVADPDTPVFLDMFAPMAMWHGATATRAPVHHFRHNDPWHLREQIRRYGPGIVGVESIYGSIGDRCPLPDILSVCDETGAMLVVDESHALGVTGPEGAGLVNELKLADRVPLRVFSLSKALVGRGGAVVGTARFCDYFRYASRASMFSATLHPWEIARLRAALEIARAEDWRRTRLATAQRVVRFGLVELGYDVSCSESQIIPLVAGTEAQTRRLRDALEARGVFGAVVSAPATPRNRSLVRLNLNAGLATDALERIVETCRLIRDDLRPDTWPTFVGQRRANGLQEAVRLNRSLSA